MYGLLGIDTVLRITVAMAIVFVAVPALAWRRPATFSRLEWFWWNLGVGITLLTLAGQFFTLLHIAGPATYITLFATIIVLGRARRAGVPPLRWIRDSYRRTVVFALHVLDRRVNLRRRFRRVVRRTRNGITRGLTERRGATIAWTAIVVAAALTRFYRPFATANLGYSDTYAHLHLMRLLEEGRQVNPAWGPYPCGMHFVILAIQRLTNADSILLMNFFGAFSGVLITIAVAYAARRVTKANMAAVVAGLLFATMIGGARQYFALGGSVSSASEPEARAVLSQTYEELNRAGEFDVMLSAFLRQTSTLPQELAIVLLFPGALFLLDWLRTRDRWRLAGFIGCTAAIAATHSGVLVPLVVLCAAASGAAFLWSGGLQPAEALGTSLWSGGLQPAGHSGGASPAPRRPEGPPLHRIARGALAGAAGVAVGSTWMLGFLRYGSTVRSDSNVGWTALYYFPFLRSFAGNIEETAYMMLTPFLIAVAAASVLLVIAAVATREGHALWIALGTLFFIATHSASTLGIPEIIEVRRNVTWLAMCVAVLIATVVTILATRLPPRAQLAVPALAVVLWCATLPNLFAPDMRARLLDYSGYGATTYAVLRISQELEPFTWTLVSYGQEYPMVLGRGFHMNGADFVEQYDPAETPLRIPTPHVFIAVEKTPHRFEIDNWSKRFDRAAVEERLQTWCAVYGMTHRNIRVWLDDEHVRVYEIVRTEGRT